jgi:hypothetical protein
MANKVSLFVVILLGLIVILGCGQLTELGKSGSNARSDDSKTFSLSGKEWKSLDLAQTDIKVDLPGTPSDKTPDVAQLPPSYKAVFSDVHIYSFDEKDFASSYTQLVPTNKMNLGIKDLADTSMTALKKQIRDLTYTLDIKSDTNAKYNGSFTRNGKSFDLRGCCVFKKTEPRRVWAVLTLYPKDNADAGQAGKRIIDSVVFNGSSEECK